MPTVQARPCADYDQADVSRAVRECLEAFPATCALMRPGARVVLKPNIINPRPPETAVCTHPALVRAVAEACCEAGCRVLVADEPGYALAGSAQVLFAACGIAPACEGLPVEFELLKHRGYRAVAPPNPLRVTETLVANLALDADLLINLPKCKTHQMSLFTGAVKNMFGAIAPRERIRIHTLGTFRAVSEALADCFSACVPHMSIMDAVVGMEGKGPSHGTPREVGLILAAEDAVALDAVTQDIVGFAPHEVGTTTAAAQKGLGEGDLGHITVEGAAPAEFRTAFARPPGGIRRGFPGWVGPLVGRMFWVRPVVAPALCVRCGACAGICPGQAVTMRDHAEIDYKKCLECFCCQEVCPAGAIDTRAGPLARRIIGGRRGVGS